VAPPKRKTGGRTTATGTRPGEKTRAHAGTSASGGATPHYDSGRYTAPTSRALEESPAWVPALMLGLFVAGALLIIARYLWWDSNIPMIAGMACLLGGLFTATKWR
jgi:hypothetical protein